MQWEDIRWLPGDEFEGARQKYQSWAIDTDAVFAGHPELKVVHIERIFYPPLARQTRISGTVVAHVSVASDGSVSEAKATKGHPLLVAAVEEPIKKWKFEAGADRTFDLTCDFVLADEPLTTRRRNAFVVEPLHIRMVVNSLSSQYHSELSSTSLANRGAEECVWKDRDPARKRPQGVKSRP